MPRVEVFTIIETKPDEAYALAKEAYLTGRFGNTSNIKSVKVLEQGEEYSISEWDTELQGRSFRWKERDTYDDANRKICYDQVEGSLAKMFGECMFEDSPEGTKAVAWLEFDFGIPMLATLLNPIAVMALRKNLREMLERLKGWAESN